MNKQFRVEEQYKDARLDHFLVAQMTDVSRSQIQKWIKQGSVNVNGKAVAKHFFLSVGDTVEVNVTAETAEKKVVPEIPVVFEDESIMVLNKPAGLVVHPPQEQYPYATVVDFLMKHDPAIRDVGEDSLRPGIVHRLDKDVSGVLVVAKTQAAFLSLKQQFMERQVEKEYRAIVYGVPSQNAGEIKFKIAHSKTQGGKMAAKPEHEEGREAWTEYTVLQAYKRYSLLSVSIKTGRTHQIRAHLAAIDHPVVGDTVYFSKRYQPSRSSQRVYLHAYRLAFQHPATGERVEYISEIPSEFAEFLQT